MNFLIDTNIFIPLEPTSPDDIGVNSDLALEFQRIANKSDNKVFVHPEIYEDIEHDNKTERRELRLKLIKRYGVLPAPPDISILDESVVGAPSKQSNDWVDNCLLAAVQGNAVDYLVTEDVGVHKKAKRLGFDERILFLVDAIELINDLFERSPEPPPTVSNPYVYEIDLNDPIFESLREDYGQEPFDNWLEKCCLKHRKAYTVRSDSGNLAAITILKTEERLPDGTEGKVLKICTFKVSEQHGGSRLGELLLKPIFEFVEENSYDYAYFSAFPKREHLIAFAEDFGFYELANHNHPNETVLCKKFTFNQDEAVQLEPLDFNIMYGPRVTSFNGNTTYIIPIKPVYHTMLFPELGPAPRSLFSASQNPCGNSIKKAYLSWSPIKRIKQGDNLLFYRSEDFSALTCVGIVEATLRSDSHEEIARFVGKRTVYSYHDIQQMCAKEVLAILFRFVRPLKPQINIHVLKDRDIIRAQPQSITKIDQDSSKWIEQQIAM